MGSSRSLSGRLRQKQDSQRQQGRDQGGLEVYAARLAPHLRQFVLIFYYLYLAAQLARPARG